MEKESLFPAPRLLLGKVARGVVGDIASSPRERMSDDWTLELAGEEASLCNGEPAKRPSPSPEREVTCLKSGE